MPPRVCLPRTAMTFPIQSKHVAVPEKSDKASSRFYGRTMDSSWPDVEYGPPTPRQQAFLRKRAKELGVQVHMQKDDDDFWTLAVVTGRGRVTTRLIPGMSWHEAMQAVGLA